MRVMALAGPALCAAEPTGDTCAGADDVLTQPGAAGQQLRASALGL
jgi:hypothetical protein